MTVTIRFVTSLVTVVSTASQLVKSLMVGLVLVSLLASVDSVNVFQSMKSLTVGFVLVSIKSTKLLDLVVSIILLVVEDSDVVSKPLTKRAFVLSKRIVVFRVVLSFPVSSSVALVDPELLGASDDAIVRLGPMLDQAEESSLDPVDSVCPSVKTVLDIPVSSSTLSLFDPELVDELSGIPELPSMSLVVDD